MKLFNTNRAARRKLSKFDKSHERKMSLNMGELIPCYLDEIVPGDRFKVNSEIMLRFAPMVAPVMHRMDVFTHYFFIPNRLVWDEWESFITGGRQGNETPTSPKLVMKGSDQALFDKGTLADYLGLPTMPPNPLQTQSINALPFRAYQLIYQEYYQDQNLSPELGIDLGSGQITDQVQIDRLTALRTRGWEKDYFTSALPWAQRSQQEVEIPIDAQWNYKDQAEFIPQQPTAAGPMGIDAIGLIEGGASSVKGGIDNIEEITGLGVTINDLRLSVRLQEWLERTARGGSRYIEQILSHFGVRSSDARLQRPEYLGGGKNPVVISEVLQTNASESDVQQQLTPQGNMAGHGISTGTSNGFNKRFEEHGFVIGILSVMPKTAYQQGIDRLWTRFDKFDYYWPEFAHLGEQPITNKEIYMDWMNADADQKNETFGYQSQWADMKYGCSKVHGDFRDELDFWHMGRIFDAPPALNQTFIDYDKDDRIFAVTDPAEDKLYAQIYNSVSALRPMPYFGTPNL